MIPTARQVGLWGIPLLFSVVAIAYDGAVAAVIAFDLLLLLLMLVDALRSRAELSVRRQVDEVMVVGGTACVGLEVVSHAHRPLFVRLSDEAPGSVTGLPVGAPLPVGGRLEVEYELRVDRRGRHGFGDVVVRTTSPWGLWERQRRFPVASSLRVYPNFGRLRSDGLSSRLAEQRAPVRARRAAGGDSEFQRLRPYVPGDSYRHVDWKATARLRKPITREYGQESNQNILFLLDAGRMMSAPMGKLTAFDHALNASLLLGQSALKRGDRVGMLVFDDQVRAWIPPKSGRRSSNRLIRATFDLQPSLEEPDYGAAYRHLVTRVRRRSLVVLFVSIVDMANAEALCRLVRGLSRRHLALVVWMRDPALDALIEEGDLFDRGAVAELFTDRAEVLARLQRGGAVVVDAPVGELRSALLARYVEIKARRLL